MVSVCEATFNQMRPVIFCLMLFTALFYCGYKYTLELRPCKEIFGCLKIFLHIYYHTQKYKYMEERNCSKCKRLLPMTQFAKSKRSSFGYCSQCKDCVKEYQLANKEKLKEYQRNYQPQYKAEHREELLAYLREYQRGAGRQKHYANIKAWRAANPEKVAQYRKVMAERKQQAND